VTGVLTTAVVGAGLLGARHARVYAEMAGCRLAGVYDVDAGRAAGCKTIWVRCDYDERQPDAPDAVVASLWQASRVILGWVARPEFSKGVIGKNTPFENSGRATQ